MVLDFFQYEKKHDEIKKKAPKCYIDIALMLHFGDIHKCYFLVFPYSEGGTP